MITTSEKVDVGILLNTNWRTEGKRASIHSTGNWIWIILVEVKNIVSGNLLINFSNLIVLFLVNSTEEVTEEKETEIVGIPENLKIKILRIN